MFVGLGVALLGVCTPAPAAASAVAFLGAEVDGETQHWIRSRRNRNVAQNSTDVENPAVAAASVAVGVRRQGAPPTLTNPRIWPHESGMNFWVKAMMVVLYLLAIASVAVIVNWDRRTKTGLLQAAALIIWLSTAVYLFTYVLYFQSPHFGNDEAGKPVIRRLNLVETIYLLSQIITTVGYGDITPAYQRGQVVVAFVVILSIMVIAGMVTEFVAVVQTRADEAAFKALKKTEKVEEAQYGEAWHKAMEAVTPRGGGTHFKEIKPVLSSLFSFGIFVAAGCLFFHLYPGEEKTVFQGIYMSIITLSTVGFGAFTANTEGGKVFAAFWMLFGVGALGALVGTFTEYMTKMKRFEQYGSLGQPDMLKELLKVMEEDKKESMDLGEFLHFALLHYGWVSEKKIYGLKKQFEAVDKDNRGKITQSDLRGMKLSPRATTAPATS